MNRKGSDPISKRTRVRRADEKDYDIFVSHSHVDTEAVKRLVAQWKRWRYRVYADFNDKVLLKASRDNVMTAALADRLFDRIRRCAVFVFVASRNSARSGWMPWELGLAHGAVGRVHLYMLVRTGRAAFARREYLELYKESTFDEESAKGYLARVVPEARREPVNPAQRRAGDLQGERAVQALLEGRPLEAFKQLTQSPLEQGGLTARGMARRISDAGTFTTTSARKSR